MGKKTLKQKKRSDEKRLHHKPASVDHARGHETPSSPTYTFSSQSQRPVTQRHVVATSQTPMAHVTQDLRKTLFLSITIVVLEVILYFLLHSHILALPFIRY